MMGDQNDYNLRQYRLMQEIISDFNLGKLSLSHLVSQIEGLIDALEGISIEVRSSLLSRWAMLEDVLAVSLYEERNALTSNEVEKLRVALIELSGFIGRYINDSDSSE